MHKARLRNVPDFTRIRLVNAAQVWLTTPNALHGWREVRREGHHNIRANWNPEWQVEVLAPGEDAPTA